MHVTRGQTDMSQVCVGARDSRVWAEGAVSVLERHRMRLQGTALDSRAQAVLCITASLRARGWERGTVSPAVLGGWEDGSRGGGTSACVSPGSLL